MLKNNIYVQITHYNVQVVLENEELNNERVNELQVTSYKRPFELIM